MNHKSVITETLQYIYSLHPKWCYAHFCYQNRRPWMTLNGVMALILRYFTKFGSFRGTLRESGRRQALYLNFMRFC